MNKEIEVSVVLPCLNEEKAIAVCIRKIKEVFASAVSILSYQMLHLGVYAHAFAIRQGFLKYDALTLFFKQRFNLERGIFLGGGIFLVGFTVMPFIFIEWFSKDFGALYRIRESILAMTLLVIGLQTVFSSFFISLLFLERK